jgi:hypothetical protein
MQPCPWSGYDPPVISFCEARRCAWIAEPANALSNLAIIAAGIWALSRKDIPPLFRALCAFVAITLGTMSFAFHASAIRVTEVLDVSGMYMLPALSLSVSLAVLFESQKHLFAVLPVFVWLFATTSMLLFHSNGVLMFIGLAVLAVGFDALTLLRVKTANFRYLGLSIAAVLAGYSIWWLDKLGLWCDPHNHYFNGHAVWHVFCGLSIALHVRHIEAKFTRGYVALANG